MGGNRLQTLGLTRRCRFTISPTSSDTTRPVYGESREGLRSTKCKVVLVTPTALLQSPQSVPKRTQAHLSPDCVLSWTKQGKLLDIWRLLLKPLRCEAGRRRLLSRFCNPRCFPSCTPAHAQLFCFVPTEAKPSRPIHIKSLASDPPSSELAGNSLMGFVTAQWNI